MKTIFKKNNALLSKTKDMKTSCQSGYSLIEVMIAAFILSFAILGIASLQMIGLKGTQQSLMKQQAMGIVQNMIERMRANQAGVIAGNYVLDSDSLNCTTTALPDCSAADCNPAQIALADQLNLVCGYGAAPGVTGGVKITNATDNAILVNGTLDVTCNGGAGINCSQGDVTITVGWDEREFGKEGPSAPDSLSIDTRIAAP